MIDTYLSVADVAARTSLAESTLYTWRAAGVGPQSCKFRGRVVYKRSVVDAWIAEQVAATARGATA